jgi:hypothetical protein
VHDLVERGADRVGDPRVVVAERRADLARGEVQDPRAVGRLDPRASARATVSGAKPPA